MSDPVGVGVALLAGVVQGVFEWLPISSEGNVALLLTAFGHDPGAAVRLSLLLHLGTAAAALTYFRDRWVRLAGALPNALRAGPDASPATIDARFVAVGTATSGITGIVGYLLLAELVTHLAGGAFLALIGVALIASGIVQRAAAGASLGARTRPSVGDAALIGVLQGAAVLPGISRSGVTVGGLLLRGYEGEVSFDLSFLLSVPAAVGAAALVVVDAGIPGLSPASAAVALAASAVVGVLTIDGLLRVVRRVPIWGVALGLGILATVGGVAVVLLPTP